MRLFLDFDLWRELEVNDFVTTGYGSELFCKYGGEAYVYRFGYEVCIVIVPKEISLNMLRVKKTYQTARCAFTF